MPLRKLKIRLQKSESAIRELQSLISVYDFNAADILVTFSENREFAEVAADWDHTFELTKAATLFSEILHQLSSTLDNIMFLLCIRNGNLSNTEKSRLKFPICKTEDDWPKSHAATIFRTHNPPELNNLLFELQPFNNRLGWDNSNLQPLVLLRELINSDKHQMLHIIETRFHNMEIKCQVTFFDEKFEFDPRSIEILGDGFWRGGQILTIDQTSPMKELSIEMTLAGKFHPKGYDIPIDKLACDLFEMVISIYNLFETLISQETVCK